MSLDSIKIPGDIVTVDGTREQYTKIFMFAISTCMWCKRGKRWLEENGYSYSYLDIDKLDVKVKDKLKADIKGVFGVRPRFPFVVINNTEWNSGYNPDVWKEMIR